MIAGPAAVSASTTGLVFDGAGAVNPARNGDVGVTAIRGGISCEFNQSKTSVHCMISGAAGIPRAQYSMYALN